MSVPANREMSDDTAQPAWMPSRPLLLTQRQAAAWLNVCERTVRNLIRKRKLPVKFIGRRCLIPTAAVEAFAR
ncbi:MAG TPA: helix-turn-helix domain-containing protein, partial [Candidatus Bathyarchaeia archaeon]|nr:helix-turn-helix domain-containing protein [Candidatus Bathyarchaeia archaeon]